jgi:hypothetical protein
VNAGPERAPVESSGHVTARHHHAVRHLEDGLQVFDRLRLFELRDDPGLGAQIRHTALYQPHVVGGSNKGNRDQVGAIPDGELQVDLVFGGQRRNTNGDARKIDPFKFAQNPAVQHLAFNIGAANAGYAQFDQAIGKQNARAFRHILRKCRKRGGDHGRGPGHIPRSDGQELTGFQRDGEPVAKPSGANFGPLQVGQDADRLFFLESDLADHLDQLELFRMRAVGEIQPGDVETGMHQFTEKMFCVAGRSQRGDNFRTPRPVKRKGSLHSCSRSPLCDRSRDFQSDCNGHAAIGARAAAKYNGFHSCITRRTTGGMELVNFTSKWKFGLSSRVNLML